MPASAPASSKVASVDGPGSLSLGEIDNVSPARALAFFTRVSDAQGESADDHFRMARSLSSGRSRRTPCGLDLREMTMTSSQLILRSLMLVALAAASSSSVWAAEAKAPLGAHAPTPAPIDRNGVLILIRSTLLALDHANKTGNYTVMRDLGSQAFQTNSAARLAEIFASERKDNVDLSGIAVLDPQLTLLPQIESNGMMHMAGFFPSVPTQVNFEMAFAPVDRQWRLFGVSVSFGQASPIAPPAAEPKDKGLQAQAAPPSAAAKAQPAPSKGNAPQAAAKP